MGFRNGAYAKVWAIDAKTDTATKLRISISRKDKTTNQYETDFSGIVTCYGADAAKQAAALQIGDKIQLGNVDVSRRFDVSTNREYINFKVFSFTMASDESSDGLGDVDAHLPPLMQLDSDEQLPF